VGYYYFADTALVLRVLMVLGGLLAARRRWLTDAGKEFFAFAQESWQEAARVVADAQGNAADDAIVFAFVVVMALSCSRRSLLAWIVKCDWDRAEVRRDEQEVVRRPRLLGFEKSVQRALTERIKRSDIADQFGRSWCRSRKWSR
jgi:hypothetical protein